MVKLGTSRTRGNVLRVISLIILITGIRILIVIVSGFLFGLLIKIFIVFIVSVFVCIVFVFIVVVFIVVVFIVVVS